jgi:tetratricopeptide (TPR) repeat protein
MSNFKTQFNNARDERETGDANKALEMFLNINKSHLESGQLFDYLGELGLTYWHVKRYEEAKSTFKDAKNLADKLNNDSYKAVALRQLSRPELNEGRSDLSVQLAQEARELASSSKREDLVWFDHGVVAALIFEGASKEEIRNWFEIEAKDLYEVSQYTKDHIAKWVWTCGLLMDRAKVFNTISDMYVALLIAEQFSLARRKEQIEKLISDFNKK